MFAPIPLIENQTIENVKEDFKSSAKVEQYRIGKEALYLPEGLRWRYLPYHAIAGADESFRVISAGAGPQIALALFGPICRMSARCSPLFELACDAGDRANSALNR